MSGEATPYPNQSEKYTTDATPTIVRNLGDVAIANNDNEGSIPSDKELSEAGPMIDPATNPEAAKKEIDDYYEQQYNDARRDGTLPEGVRDVNDYREMLAETRARNKELGEWKSEAISDVYAIKDHYDRDLATSLLPFFNFIQKERPRDTRSDDEKYRDGKKQRRIFKTVIDFLNTDHENQSLYSHLVDEGHKAGDKGDKEALFDYITFADKIERYGVEYGNKIERLNHERIGSFSIQFRNRNYDFTDRHAYVDIAMTSIILDMARGIESNNTEEMSSYEQARADFNLDELSRLSYGRPKIEELDISEKRFINRVLSKEIEKAENSDDIAHEKIDFDLAAAVVWYEQLKDELTDRRDKYDEYLRCVEQGKKILPFEM